MADSLSLPSFLSGTFTQSVESLAYRMQLFVYRARINVCASLMSVIAMKPILRSFVPREVVDEGSGFFFFMGRSLLNQAAVDIVDKLTSARAHAKFWEFP